MEGVWNLMEKIEKAKDYYRCRKYCESIESAKEGLNISKEMTCEEAQACHVLAWAYYMVRDYEQGRKYGNRFLKISKKIRDRKLEAKARLFLACLFHMLEDFGQSKNNGNQSLRIAEEVKDEALQARAHHVLSKTCYMVADHNIPIDLGDSVLEGGACLDILTPLYHLSDRVTRGFQNIEDQSLNNGVKGGEPKPESFEVQANSYHAKEAVNRTPEARSQLSWLRYGDNVHSPQSRIVITGKHF